MTLAHFVYIPGVFLLGALIGYVLGGRAVESAKAERADRSRRRDARRRRRAEATSDGAPPHGPG